LEGLRPLRGGDEGAVRRGRVVLEHLQALADVERAGAVLGVVDPDLGQAAFIAHCRRGAASFISASMTSSNPARSRPAGFLATRSVVSAHPAPAMTGSGSADQARRSSSACGLFFTT